MYGNIYDRVKPSIIVTYFVLIAIIVFSHNGTVTLWDQDEAAYAGFAREMVASGDWAIPEFMWSEIHRKPPLHFWNICLSYKLFGINEFSVRFPSALFILLTYLLIYFAGRPLFGDKIAFFGTVVLSTTLFIPSLAKVSVTDATLLFFSTLCAFATIYILEKRSLGWSIIFWMAFSLALLTKGPPVILFTAVLTGILFLLHPKRKNLIVLHPWFFLPVACLPLFLWGYYISKNDGGVFIQWMIDWYILKRVNGSVLGQTGPPGTHLLGIILFFLPYFMFFPRAFWNSISGIFKKDKGSIFFLSAWFIAGWFLYEWSPSKLPSYVVAAHVPLAILIGKNLVECLETKVRPVKALAFLHFGSMALVSVALLVVPVILQLPFSIKLYFGIVSILLFLSITVAFYHVQSNRFVSLLIGVNLFFQAAVWVVLLPQVDKLKNASKEVANYVKNHAENTSTILIGNDEGRPPSLPFYLSLSFKEIEEENNVNTLMDKFLAGKPYVLILSKEQRDSTVSLLPQLKFKEVSSILTDRNKKVRYYIAINEPAYRSTAANYNLQKETIKNINRAAEM